MIHVLRILIISAFIILCIFLPFIPGRYDSTSIILSFIAQVLGFSSLLFIPVGVIWILYDQSKERSSIQIRRNRTQGFVVASLILLFLILSIVSLSAVSLGNIFLGLLIFAASCYGILLIRKNGDYLEKYRVGKFNALPFYLVFIPLIVMIFRFAFIKPATEFSRNYAIKNSEGLIRDIEAYHTTHGFYPLSLNSVNKDYEPTVMGIRQYVYEPFGKAYNLYFEQFTYQLDVKEVVMYNKLDEHAIASHELDILEYSGKQLALRRGDRRRFDLSQKHWKVIWMD